MLRGTRPPQVPHEKLRKTMTTMILIAPYLAFGLGAAMMARALHLNSEIRSLAVESNWRRVALLFCATLALPSLAHAAMVDLKTATESGNAIIMYLSGTLAAVGIVAAGVAPVCYGDCYGDCYGRRLGILARRSPPAASSGALARATASASTFRE